MNANVCTIERNAMGRWYLQHQYSRLAWSGCQWVTHYEGLPTNVQICNFDSSDEARVYAKQFGLKVSN